MNIAMLILYLLHILRSIICSRVPMGATNMRVPGRNIYMSVHGGVSTHNFVYTNIFVCRFSRIQYPKNQPIDASWHDSCHIASGPCIVVPAYLFIQACSFLRLFRHNFTENGPQDLRENGLKRRVTQFYTICDKNQLINKNIRKVMASSCNPNVHRIGCTGLGARYTCWLLVSGTITLLKN